MCVYILYIYYANDVFETQLLDLLQLRPKAAMGAAEGPHGWFGLRHSGASAEARYFVAFHRAPWQPSNQRPSNTINHHQQPSLAINVHQWEFVHDFFSVTCHFWAASSLKKKRHLSFKSEAGGMHIAIQSASVFADHLADSRRLGQENSSVLHRRIHQCCNPDVFKCVLLRLNCFSAA